MTLFEKIQQALPQLSEAKANVAHYLMENWLEAAFVPAAGVARKAKVSESVVVRFAQEIGYSGFPELQQELQGILKDRLTSVSGGSTSVLPEEENVEQFDEQQSNKEIQRVYNLTVENLHETFLQNSYEMFAKVVEMINKAERVVVLARKNSLGPATVLNLHLNEIYSKSTLLNGSNDESLDIIKGLRDRDLLITIAIPSYSKRMVQITEFAVERKIPYISITDSYSSPFAKNAQVVLLTKVRSHAFCNSHVSTLFIIDVLVYLINLQKKGEILKSLEFIKVLNERFGITFR